ncbi:MAG: T9SS type A sorting domain-containing protein [Elusimicrobia bacterium]|nr:T9SS type A sorting domain-containing protein [Elusimicrobiota bacterium]
MYRDGLLIAEVERAPFVDKDVPAGNRRYQITGVDGAGNESALSTPTVSGDLQGPIPAAGEVYSYPNPAVGGVAPVIRAQLADADRATVKIYDISGHLVETGELRPVPSADSATPFEYAWTGPIASGTYFGVVETHQSGILTHSRLKISVVR